MEKQVDMEIRLRDNVDQLPLNESKFKEVQKAVEDSLKSNPQLEQMSEQLDFSMVSSRLNISGLGQDIMSKIVSTLETVCQNLSTSFIGRAVYSNGNIFTFQTEK